MRLTALFAMTLLLCGCGQVPRVEVSASIENGEVVFNISRSGGNGILGFAVSESGKQLWGTQLNYYRGKKIIFGRSPQSETVQAGYAIPLKDGQPPDIRGKTVTVAVTVQYDVGLSPSAQTFERVVVVPTS